jgi:hypothetical protein
MNQSHIKWKGTRIVDFMIRYLVSIEIRKYDVAIQVLTAVTVKSSTKHLHTSRSSILWVLTPCSPLKVNQQLRGTWRLNLQG